MLTSAVRNVYGPHLKLARCARWVDLTWNNYRQTPARSSRGEGIFRDDHCLPMDEDAGRATAAGLTAPEKKLARSAFW